MKPNIVIVMTDQQRADLRKSCGCKLDTMPFLDEWAKGGVDFEKAYTPNPICLAARASMFTGRYSQSHGIRSNQNEEDIKYTKDLLDVFKDNGYVTALCGKNHTYHRKCDFDFWEETGHLNSDIPGEKTIEQKEFYKFLEDTKFVDSQKPSPHDVKVQNPYANVNSAFKFIDEYTNNKPFFCWVSFAEPHNPYQVPYPYYDMFPPKDLPECISASDAKKFDKGERYERMRKVWEQVYSPNVEEHILRSRSNYFGMLRLIDDQFKRLIEGLRDRNLEDNTIVIYLSDHGDFVGEYGLVRKGADLSNLLINIPMIWRGPKIKSIGKKDDCYVSLVDILPTICDILEVDIPLGTQGKSILPLLQNNHDYDVEFDCAYIESGFSGMYWDDEDNLSYQAEGATKNMTEFDCLNTWTQCGQMRSLVKDNYRIQIDMMGNAYLYSLKDDPKELINLWNDDKYQNVKIDMMENLITMGLKNCDVLPFPRNRYRTKIHPKGYWYQKYHCNDPGVRQTKLNDRRKLYENRKNK